MSDLHLQCVGCHHYGSPILTGSGPHVKAVCRNCSAFIKFLNKQERMLATTYPPAVSPTEAEIAIGNYFHMLDYPDHPIY